MSMAAAFPPSTFHLPSRLETTSSFEPLIASRNPPHALGRVVARLALEDADLHRLVADQLERVFAFLVRAVALRIADDRVHRGGEVSDVGIDDDHGDACVHRAFDQRRGRVLVVRRQDDGLNLLRDDVLEHAHLAIDVGATLRRQHEHIDAALGGGVFDALADSDVVVELRRRRHVGDTSAFRALEAFDRRLGGLLKRLRRRISLVGKGAADAPCQTKRKAHDRKAYCSIHENSSLTSFSKDASSGERRIDDAPHARSEIEERAGRRLSRKLLGRRAEPRRGDVERGEIGSAECAARRLQRRNFDNLVDRPVGKDPDHAASFPDCVPDRSLGVDAGTIRDAGLAL